MTITPRYEPDPDLDELDDVTTGERAAPRSGEVVAAASERRTLLDLSEWEIGNLTRGDLVGRVREAQAELRALHLCVNAEIDRHKDTLYERDEARRELAEEREKDAEAGVIGYTPEGSPVYGNVSPRSITKTTSGKRDWSLMPLDVFGQIIDVMQDANERHGDSYTPGSWRETPDWVATYTAAILRHLTGLATGQERDPRSGMLHVACIGSNAAIMIARAMRDAEVAK